MHQAKIEIAPCRDQNVVRNENLHLIVQPVEQVAMTADFQGIVDNLDKGGDITKRQARYEWHTSVLCIKNYASST